VLVKGATKLATAFYPSPILFFWDGGGGRGQTTQIGLLVIEVTTLVAGYVKKTAQVVVTCTVRFFTPSSSPQ
jgi:hypothetical protein